MAKAFAFIKQYKQLELPIKNAVAAEFFIQMVNATFMTVLPLYMQKEGFSNHEIALFITFRFLGVFVLALPLGRFIKGKKLLPLFFLSSICVPVFGVGIVLCTALKLKLILYVTLLLWGASFTFMQIPIFPYILRNSKKEHHTAAISLSYTTWSFGGIVFSVVTFLLDLIDPHLFDEQFILLLFSGFGLGGIFFLNRIKDFKEVTAEAGDDLVKRKATKHDWKIMSKALWPTLIIATGAGLTIPFISMFFNDVHGMGKGGFSGLSFFASLFVAWLALLVPKIKEKIGYKVAIPTTQSLAVFSLVVLATTQYYKQFPVAVVIASIFYIIRQPLMNMAGPMTSELVLNYVGKRNREITSALTSAIWSGSWVLGATMVTIFFTYHLDYVHIFLTTSLLYGLGVVLYYLLILDYTKKEEQGLIED